MGRDRKATWMAKFEIPIRDAVETVEFPDGWQVNWAPIADVPALTPDQMRAALAAPMQRPPPNHVADRVAVANGSDSRRPATR